MSFKRRVRPLIATSGYLKEKTIPDTAHEKHGHTFLKPYNNTIVSVAMRTDKAFKNVLVHVGNQLAYLRVKKGYPTIKSFAQKYDLPEIQYWRIERGKANITLKSLSRILNIHRLTLNEFFCMINEEKAAA